MLSPQRVKDEITVPSPRPCLAFRRRAFSQGQLKKTGDVGTGQGCGQGVLRCPVIIVSRKRWLCPPQSVTYYNFFPGPPSPFSASLLAVQWRIPTVPRPREGSHSRAVGRRVKSLEIRRLQLIWRENVPLRLSFLHQFTKEATDGVRRRTSSCRWFIFAFLILGVLAQFCSLSQFYIILLISMRDFCGILLFILLVAMETSTVVP